MINRIANTLAIALHVGLILLLGRISFAVVVSEPRKKGMEIEITDLAYAMPDPKPRIGSSSPVRQPNAQVTDRATATATEPVETAQPKPDVVATTATPAGEPEVAPKPLSSPVPEPTPVSDSVVRAANAPAATPAGTNAGNPGRLDTKALSGLPALAGNEVGPSRLDSATLGSAVGKAAPRGVRGLTFRQKVDLAAMIRAQIMPCWNPPEFDAPPPVSVRLRFRLDRNGRVVGQPAGSGAGDQRYAASAYAGLLTNSGRRAVMLCSPFRLPPELYEAWASVEVEFDPRGLR